MPLEELAALFGDKEEVAVYQADIGVKSGSHAITDRSGKNNEASHLEKVTADV